MKSVRAVIMGKDGVGKSGEKSRWVFVSESWNFLHTQQVKYISCPSGRFRSFAYLKLWMSICVHDVGYLKRRTTGEFEVEFDHLNLFEDFADSKLQS